MTDRIESPKSFRFLSEEKLMTQCRVDQFRGSGPGGQKRNKTSNAVRIVHEPTGIEATGTESRSLLENRLHAIRRLRVRIAADVREAIDLPKFEPPDWFLSVKRDTRIEASHRHEFYAPVAGLILDLLKEMKGNPSHVGTMLGVSTTAVVKILESDPHFWMAANKIRAEWGMKPLTRRD